MNVSFVVVFGTSASESYLIRVTSVCDMKSIRMFEDMVTSPEHALVIHGDSLLRGFGLVA
jgi:hypothetical protein